MKNSHDVFRLIMMEQNSTKMDFLFVCRFIKDNFVLPYCFLVSQHYSISFISEINQFITNLIYKFLLISDY
jgi:hypothetical protein